MTRIEGFLQEILGGLLVPDEAQDEVVDGRR